MNNEELKTFLEKADAQGIIPGLSRVKAILKAFGNPQDQMNVIHIAGTNGKGSVCAYIAGALTGAGYKTGLFTSPAVVSDLDKWSIDGKWIDEKELEALRLEVAGEGRRQVVFGLAMPTAFEIDTIAAFLYFYRHDCDFVVLECGMGGRLDATNVVKKPLITGVTAIDMDHNRFLGNSLTSIAREKAGIFRESVPVIYLISHEESDEVILEAAKELGCPVRPINREEAVLVSGDAESGIVIRMDQNRIFSTLSGGLYQVLNLATTIRILDVLGGLEKTVFPKALRKMPSEVLTDAVIESGIKAVLRPGRFEVVCHDPTVILDGAHNPDGMRNLVDSIKRHYSGRKVIPVMGVFEDKAYVQEVEILSEIADVLLTFKAPTDRGLPGRLLAEEAAAYFKEVVAFESQEEALKEALDRAGSDGQFRDAHAQPLILHTGSLSTIAGARDYLKKRQETGSEVRA